MWVSHPRGSALRTGFICSSLPSLPFRLPQGPTAEKMVKEPQTQRKNQGWVVRKVGCRQMTGLGLEAEGSITFLRPPATVLVLSQTQLPVESRSGPPSPDGLSETSFSAALAPVWANISRKTEAPRKARHLGDISTLAEGRMNPDLPYHLTGDPHQCRKATIAPTKHWTSGERTGES